MMDDKIDAIVSGGTQGIGKYISTILDDMGWKVLALYKSNDEVAELFVKETKISVMQCDVTIQQQVDNLVGVLEITKSTPCILVNNAGGNDDSTIWNMTPMKWYDVIDTILGGTYSLTKAILPFMRDQRQGCIINISSVVAFRGVYGTSNYATAKAGLEGFVKSVSKELAKSHININNLALGYFNTGIIGTVPAKRLEAIIAQVPIRRLGTRHDLERAMEFLITSEFYTGQTLHLNGGLYP